MTVILTAAMLVLYLQIITSAKVWRGLSPATTKKKEGGFVSTKLVLPLLVVLPDKPGNPVTPITAGYTTYTCERGDSYTGHEHSYTEETTEPRCTQAGYTIYTCFCGDCYQVKLPALGHDDVLVGQSGMMYKTFKFQQKAKSIHTLYGYKK